MKFIFTLILTFYVGSLLAQNEAAVNNTSNSFSTVLKPNADNFSGGFFFYNPRRDVKGTVYLFDDWSNFAMISTKDNYKFLVRNVNINIERNNIQAKISNDSIFEFNLNDIEKITINNKVYKNIYGKNGKRIYEIIYESDSFSILKGFETKIISGSPNPMVNRSDDKIVRNKSYFLKTEMNINPFRLSKNKILKLLANDQERINKIKQYVKSNRLSYKKDEDVRKALKATEK